MKEKLEKILKMLGVTGDQIQAEIDQLSTKFGVRLIKNVCDRVGEAHAKEIQVFTEGNKPDGDTLLAFLKKTHGNAGLSEPFEKIMADAMAAMLEETMLEKAKDRTEEEQMTLRDQIMAILSGAEG